MSDEIAKKFGLKIGQKVLYPEYIPYAVNTRIITIKDVRLLFGDEGEVVVDAEEFDGYIYLSDIYTQASILQMFGISGEDIAYVVDLLDKEMSSAISSEASGEITKDAKKEKLDYLRNLRSKLEEDE